MGKKLNIYKHISYLIFMVIRMDDFKIIAKIFYASYSGIKYFIFNTFMSRLSKASDVLG